MYFRSFVLISLWKRAKPCIPANLNLICLRMFCIKLGWNWPIGSWVFFLLRECTCILAISLTSPWKSVGPFLWTNLNPHHPSLLEIATVVLEEKILNFVNEFSLFRYYLPLEKERGLHLNKIDFPLPKDFVPNLVEISQVVLEKKIFKISLIYFRYFVIISPFKRAGPFIWKKLESSSPKDALWKVWLKLALCFWRRRFLNFVNIFSHFLHYLPLTKDMVLLMKKIESPSLKDAFWHV